jgi:hypothetical protein
MPAAKLSLAATRKLSSSRSGRRDSTELREVCTGEGEGFSRTAGSDPLERSTGGRARKRAKTTPQWGHSTVPGNFGFSQAGQFGAPSVTGRS